MACFCAARRGGWDGAPSRRGPLARPCQPSPGSARMRLAVCLFALLVLGPATPARPQSAQDSLGTRQAALDSTEGRHAGDRDRMTGAQQADGAKRVMFSDTLGNVW